MLNIADNRSRLDWLTANLANRRNNILDIIQRLTGLGNGILRPGMYAKFCRWVDELATLKRDEMRIMGRIEDVEREHRLMRQANKLRRAGPPRAVTEECSYEEYKARRPAQSIMLLIVLWYLFVRQKINHKKQALTAD